ncbi:MAG: gamma-glutamyl-gamma-aminobutyrate hydrolase family protein [Alphaproteobacteria bacterium]
MNEKPPVIGISGQDMASGSLRSMVAQVRAMGGIPLVLSNFTDGRRDPGADVEKIDALIVMGNDKDIDPAVYNQASHPKTNPETATEEGKARAQYEYQIMDKALARGMPVLGVCAGMQRLNVLLGGSLHQHIPDLTGHDEHAQNTAGIAPYVPVEPVIIQQGTTLAGIADQTQSYYMPSHTASGDAVFMENSFHHQAVDRIGQGLRASAQAKDEITYSDGTKKRLVEAIEADPNGMFKDQFVLGVQWHPEFAASELAPKIVGTLVDKGREYAQKHAREHAPEQALVENAISAEAKIDPASEGQQGITRPGSWTDTIRQDRVNRSLHIRR